MLYTIVSEREIFPSAPPDGSVKYRRITGGIVEYREGAQNSVVRLHSTDPRMYLRPELAPDAKINWNLLCGKN